ncbi:MAG: hypothetical protein M9947_11385 [Thermomicrobiales bacterium]|nr:hypothetical protein [Thermomicrobiales bacterium]
MSRSELTDAYVSGRISRRSFVRGMVALGASVPVAMALADKVSAAPGGAARISRSADVYPDPYPYPPKPHKPHHHHKPKKPAAAVTTLPATGVAQQDQSSVVAPLAAGAAAAALVALRMRQPKKTEGEA